MKGIARGLRRIREGEGFTIVELTLVIVISVIMLAGMAALVKTSIDLFNNGKNLQAVTDSARRALQSMARQMRDALHIDNANTDNTQFTFWADIDNDNGNAVNINSYDGVTEKVRFYREAAYNRAVEQVTQPTSEGGGTTASSLSSFVTDLRFFCFPRYVMPGGSDPLNPTGYIPSGGDENGEAAMVRIVMRLSKGKVRRAFHQDVFLRVLERSD